MKILYITHLYPPEHIGGTENYTHALAKGLIALGHETQVLCVTEWGHGEQYWNGQSDDLFEGVPVRRLALNWMKAPDVNRYLYDNPIVGNYVEKYLGEFKPDLVHVTSCNTLSASVIDAAKQAGLPIVVTLTDFWFACPRVTLVKGNGTICDGDVPESECLRCLLHQSKAYRLPRFLLRENLTIKLLSKVSQYGAVTRIPGLRGMAMNIHDRRTTLHRALEKADRVLIASRHARDLFELNGFSRPIEVVPYGHDLSWLNSYPGKTPRDVVNFGFIGQISPMKGPHLLIDAFNSLGQEGKARLLIYGNMDKDPGFGQQLRLLADGRSDIEFRGAYAHPESGKVFSEIDVLVVPSLWRDYPLIVNEAFATRTPVIATDIDGLTEFVKPEINGLLFKRNSSEDLARQLRRLITEPELLPRLRSGIPPVRCIDEAIEEMFGIYESVSVKHQKVMS